MAPVNMHETQFLITIGVAHVMSLVIIVAGYVVQNANLNSRMAEQSATMNARMNDMRAEFRDVLRAELAAVRAEMAKNHSELLSALAQHEHRITKP